MPNQTARGLRRDMTDAEQALWRVLRSRRLQGFKFRRQHPFGPYILDFACLEHSLVIEVDGGQHADSTTDELRTARLNEHGWRILRFWNNDVLRNPDAVAQSVLDLLRAAAAGPSPSR